MEQVELFSIILRWLRYVLEYRLSATYPEETNLDVFGCPMRFPRVAKNPKIVNSEEIVKLPDFIKAGRLYQQKRKQFQAALVQTKPGFYLNFLPSAFILHIIGKYLDGNGEITAKIEYLHLPKLNDEDLKKTGIITYRDDSDLKELISLIRKTNLYLTSFNIKLSDGLRSMSIKCYEHEGVVTFWEPSFVGDIVSKDKSKAFFKFVSRMSYKEAISYEKKQDGEIYLKA
jgi:hypothetical protein